MLGFVSPLAVSMHAFGPTSTLHPVQGDFRISAPLAVRRKATIEPPAVAGSASAACSSPESELAAEGARASVQTSVLPSRSRACTPSERTIGPETGADPSASGPSSAPVPASQSHASPSSVRSRILP